MAGFRVPRDRNCHLPRVNCGPKSCTVAGGARYVANVGSVGSPREGLCGTYCTYDVQSGKLQFVFLEK